MQTDGRLGACLRAVLIIAILISGGIFVALGDLEKTLKAATDSSEGVTSRTDSDTIIVENKGYKKDRKGPGSFDHKKHASEYKVPCWQCHDDLSDGKMIWSPWGGPKKCIECHRGVPLIRGHG